MREITPGIGSMQNNTQPDLVNHPPHYKQVPGIECIDVVEHFSFLRGNAMKYLWRAGSKGDTVQDLKKSIWYIQREIDTYSMIEEAEEL